MEDKEQGRTLQRLELNVTRTNSKEVPPKNRIGTSPTLGQGGLHNACLAESHGCYRTVTTVCHPFLPFSSFIVDW